MSINFNVLYRSRILWIHILSQFTTHNRLCETKTYCPDVQVCSSSGAHYKAKIIQCIRENNI